MQLTLGMNAFITAQGFARTSMLSVLIGAVINIVLDPVFIFGLGMGVKGAALATVLSQACSCIWVLAFLCGKKTHLRLKGKIWFAGKYYLAEYCTWNSNVYYAGKRERDFSLL